MLTHQLYESTSYLEWDTFGPKNESIILREFHLDSCLGIDEKYTCYNLSSQINKNKTHLGLFWFLMVLLRNTKNTGLPNQMENLGFREVLK